MITSPYFVHLYRGRQLKYHASLPLMDVVRHSVERLFGRPLRPSVYLTLHILNYPAPQVGPGLPVLYNLEPAWGYCWVSVEEDGRLTYQHPHSVQQIVGEALQMQIKHVYPEDDLWAYRVDIPGMPPPLPLPREISYRPTPEVKHSFFVDSSRPAASFGFGIKRVEEPPPVLASCADYGVEPDGERATAPIKVLMPGELDHDLHHLRPLSVAMEEGGFLLGRVFREREDVERHLVVVEQAIAAEHSGASLSHFTFTGDSFMAIKATLQRRFPELRIVGWYHTHLFAATEAMGLSYIDLDLHFGTFTMAWQLAGLINQFDNQRVLRFYRRDKDTMSLCPHWVLP